MSTQNQDNNIESALKSEEPDIERLLLAGKSIQVKPQGYSMYPMLIPNRDEVIIAPLGSTRLKRGDVVLYRREKSILVLHRIWKIKNGALFMVGDNQSDVEGPLEIRQIKGILTAFIRKGKYIPVTNPLYRLASHIWLCLLPWRDSIKRPAAALKQRLSGNKGNAGQE